MEFFIVIPLVIAFSCLALGIIALENGQGDPAMVFFGVFALIVLTQVSTSLYHWHQQDLIEKKATELGYGEYENGKFYWTEEVLSEE